MGDFSQLSRFNPNANFKLVRIGADCPVLEVELNEMQDISEDRFKNLIKSYFGDSVQGDGTYLYRNNTLTIENESAFVDGNVVEITTLNINASEGEKIYLKVWEATVSTGDLIRFKGNQQESRTVPNTILDQRVGKETSRRIQVQYDLSKANGDMNAKYLYLGKISGGKFLLEAKIQSEATCISVERNVSQGSQRIFSTKHPYKMGIHSLSVYIDGVFQTPEVSFTELSNTTFSLANPVEAGVEVLAVYQKVVTSTVSKGHSNTHQKGGSDPLDVVDLADRTGLIPKIIKKIESKNIDGGYFRDASSPTDEVYDGGVF